MPHLHLNIILPAMVDTSGFDYRLLRDDWSLPT